MNSKNYLTPIIIALLEQLNICDKSYRVESFTLEGFEEDFYVINGSLYLIDIEVATIYSDGLIVFNSKKSRKLVKEHLYSAAFTYFLNYSVE